MPLLVCFGSASPGLNYLKKSQGVETLLITSCAFEDCSDYSLTNIYAYYIASFPVLQVTIAVVEDWERVYLLSHTTFGPTVVDYHSANTDIILA